MRAVRLLFPVAVVVCGLAPAPALALSEKGEGALRIIEFNKVDLTRRPFPDGSPAWVMKQELHPLEQKLEAVKEALGRLSADDRADPKGAAAVKWVAEFEATLTRWQQEASQAGDQAKKVAQVKRDFEGAAREVQDSLDLVHAARGEYGYSMEPKEMLERWQKATALDGFAARCKEEFAPVDQTDAAEAKARNCKDAAEWRAVLAPLYDGLSRKNIARLARDIKLGVDTVAEGGWVEPPPILHAERPAEVIDPIQPEYQSVYKTIGQPLPADLFNPIHDEAKKLEAAARASQAKVSYKAGAHSDAAVSKAVRARLEELGVKVSKVSQTTADWNIRKNPIGMPISRARPSVALGRVAGESFCRLYEFDTIQPYAGAGRYTGNLVAEVSPASRFRVAACGQ